MFCITRQLHTSVHARDACLWRSYTTTAVSTDKIRTNKTGAYMNNQESKPSAAVFQKNIVSFNLRTPGSILLWDVYPRELHHTVTLNQVKPYLNIKPSHHDCGRLWIASKVTPLSLIVNIEGNGTKFIFDIKMKIQWTSTQENLNLTIQTYLV